MNNNTNTSNITSDITKARRNGVVVSGLRRLGLVGATVVVGATAITACGSAAPESASLPPVPEGRVVSQVLADPGPAHAPDTELLEVILSGGPVVEFGGMPAPMGEPGRVSRAAISVVEFGGMPAPVGQPEQVSRAVGSVVEFGGLTAPIGWPNWDALTEAAAHVEFGGMPAPVGEPGSGGFDGGLEPGAHAGPR